MKSERNLRVQIFSAATLSVKLFQLSKHDGCFPYGIFVHLSVTQVVGGDRVFQLRVIKKEVF